MSMIKSEKYGAQRRMAIVLMLICIATVFSGCKGKQYNTKEDYKNTITEFAEKYGFDIVDEKKLWTDTYEMSISNGTELYEFSFTLGTEKQMNQFDISCENPVSFDIILEITNELSKKKFSEEFYYNLINNENPFYNNDDDQHTHYKDEYDFYKSDYFVIYDSELFSIRDDNYHLAYYSYTVGFTVLSISGGTK